VREIELRLAVAREDMAKLRKALLSLAREPRLSRVTLTSTYYDTPDRRLEQTGLTLCVRKYRRTYIQTVKAPEFAGADLLACKEWGDRIASAQPDLDAPNSGSHVPAKRQALRPLFTTLVQRSTALLKPQDGTEIEAALDKGEIQACQGDAREPVSEIELGLKSGDPAALYDLALRLVETVPLRIEARSKAERGYRLVDRRAAKPPVLHVTSAALEPGATVEATLQRIGRQCLAGILRNESAALADVPEAVHQMRVAVRRLRAALSAVKPMLPMDQFRWTDHELKWLGGALGPARNWDVFAQGLLEPVAEALPEERDLARLSRATERKRSDAYRRAKHAILSPRYTVAMLRLARWFEARGWSEQPVTQSSAKLITPIGEVAAELIERRYRKAKKRSRNFVDLPPRERHLLRIGLKKLRYTIDLLEPLFAKRRTRPFLKRLKGLQDDLGHANDVNAARNLLADVANGQHVAALDRASGIVLGWHDRGLAEQEARLRANVRRFRQAKPFW